MRICLIDPGAVAWGAPAHSVEALAAVLARRHQVTVVHSGPDAAEREGDRESDGYRSLAAPPELVAEFHFSCDDHRASAAAMAAIRAAYGDRGPDYLEVCDFRGHGLVPLQARRTGDPLLRDTLVGVRISPSSELLCLHDRALGGPGMARIAELERAQLGLADRLISPGGDCLDLYRRYYSELELPTAAEIRPALAAPAQEPPPRDPIDPHRGLRILYLADLRRRSGAMDLVEACLGLDRDDWQLTLAGADSPTATMGQSVRETIDAMVGEDPRVRFVDPPTASRLAPLFAAHDVLVVPQRFGLGEAATLAAMSSGLPIVATPVGDLVDVVEDGVNGWLADGTGVAPLRRVLARLLAEPAAVDRVIASGAPRQRYLRLSDDDSLLSAYEELLGHGSPPPPPTPSAEPSVTVVVPYFRTADHVCEAVASALAQTHRDLDVLIVNDGSFARDDGVLDELERDPRVSVVTQLNRGESDARNLGARLARGEYVVMLDADNLLDPGFVERALVAFRHRPELSYVSCWLRMIEPDGSPVSSGIRGFAALGNQVLAGEEENWDGDTLAMLPRSLFASDGFGFGGSMHSDWLLYRVLRSRGRFGAVVPEGLASYRVLGTSLMRTHGDGLLETSWRESRDWSRASATRWHARVEMSDESIENGNREEELLRVNAELAAEVRSLALGASDAPRSAAMPTSRRLAVLLGQRDAALAELNAVNGELAQVAAHRDHLEQHVERLAAEVIRLRSGWRGLMRRARARLLRR